MAQGRRDFLFGIDQGTRAFERLEGAEGALRRPPRPRAVDVPGGGHRLPDDARCAPGSTASCARPAVTAHSRPVYLAPENFAGQTTRPWDAPRPSRRPSSRSRGVTTSRGAARRSRTIRPLRNGDRDLRRADGADDDRRERRLVAARRRAHRAHARRGSEIVVSAGGVPTRAGARKVTIQLRRTRRRWSRAARGSR